MRTSNKILLGGFVATILIITGIHAVLYAKIKNGDLVTFKNENVDNVDSILLGNNIKHVLIRGMEGIAITAGDTAAMTVNRNHLNRFQYRVAGDSLVIEAGLRQADYEAGGRRYASVVLQLPPVISITANFSQVFLQGPEDSAKAISQNIFSANSELNVRAGSRDMKPAYWKNLQVMALHSQTIFTEGAVINELFVNLNANSGLTDAGADLQHFSLQVDSTSTVSLRKKSLNNIKLVK
jgi:hypothetical protein